MGVPHVHIKKAAMMVLYSGPVDPYSHAVRIALCEKNIKTETIEVYLEEPDSFKQVKDLNPYGTLPILVDRDLILYDPRIIMEYLDERFPYPPLLPVYPVQRAKYRHFVYRLYQDLYSLSLQIGQTIDENEKAKIRNKILDYLKGLATVLQNTPYFHSEEFTIVDCVMAAFLWRLKLYAIELPRSTTNSLIAYSHRLFSRAAFQESLTIEEREIG